MHPLISLLTLFVWFGFIPGPRTSNGTLISNSYSCRLSIGKENWPRQLKNDKKLNGFLVVFFSKTPVLYNTSIRLFFQVSQN